MLKLVPIIQPSTDETIRKRVRAMQKPSTLLQCSRCGGRELIETKTGVLLKGGKPSGGVKQYLCAICWRDGDRVVIT